MRASPYREIQRNASHSRTWSFTSISVAVYSWVYFVLGFKWCLLDAHAGCSCRRIRHTPGKMSTVFSVLSIMCEALVSYAAPLFWPLPHYLPTIKALPRKHNPRTCKYDVWHLRVCTHTTLTLNIHHVYSDSPSHYSCTYIMLKQ